MTATTVPIDIVCPDWCQIDPAEHVADLGDLEGSCIHWAPSWFADDPVGYLVNPLLESTRQHTKSIEVRVTTSTQPNGRLNAVPLVFIDDSEHTVEQVECLLATLQEALEFLRASHSDGA